MVRMKITSRKKINNRRRGQSFGARTTFFSKCFTRPRLALLLFGIFSGYLFSLWTVFKSDMDPVFQQKNDSGNYQSAPVNNVSESDSNQSSNIRGKRPILDNLQEQATGNEAPDDKEEDTGDTDVVEPNADENKDVDVNPDESPMKDAEAAAEEEKAMLEYSKRLKESQSQEIKELEDAKAPVSELVLLEQDKYFSSQSIPTTTTPYIMKTPKIPDSKRLKIMVTGGAGFVGSHLVDKLMQEGHEVIVVDNFFTGQKKNIEHWLHHPNFR